MQRRPPYQQLQPEERMTIASLRQQGSSVRAMARRRIPFFIRSRCCAILP
ncbi:MAG: helix-turn-helix domain-containing protein [Pseudomonadota bacterium]|nr:helix-turn-helix domain-containing protein [Pseudomonadota bacterium]